MEDKFVADINDFDIKMDKAYQELKEGSFFPDSSILDLSSVKDSVESLTFEELDDLFQHYTL